MLKKVFGGVRLTWPRLLLFSVAMGVVGALAAMLVPDGWSLHEIAVHLEFWILCAIFIITNCGSAKEAAVKTFVFFLISQPLIYLIQVPFNWMGWQIFQFYPHWLIITVLTLPGAFIGWYIKRNDLLSGLILSVMLAALVCFGVGYLKDAVGNFPRHVLSTLFCFGQIPLYVWGILQNRRARLLALAISVAALLVFGFLTLRQPEVQLHQIMSLDTEKYPADDSWSAEIEDKKLGTATLRDADELGWLIDLDLYTKDRVPVVLRDGEGGEYVLTVWYENNAGLQVED